jgi:peptidoglycan hydrolase CwlO-like protein
MKVRSILRHAKEDVARASTKLWFGLQGNEQKINREVSRITKDIYADHVEKRKHLVNRIHQLQTEVEQLKQELELLKGKP